MKWSTLMILAALLVSAAVFGIGCAAGKDAHEPHQKDAPSSTQDHSKHMGHNQ